MVANKSSGGSGKKTGPPRIINRKARHLYEIEETFEFGIVLIGSEVKSLRGGNANLQDGYAKIVRGELFLHGLHISPFENRNTFHDLDPKRERKLLAHKKQIAKLEVSLAQCGYTLVPLKIYFTKSFAKVQLGLGKGKKLYDKRESLKRKTVDREMERAMKER